MSTGTGTTHRTFCRLCEVGCGIVVQVDDGAVVKVRPDADHPVTKGFACNKGLLATEIHQDPDRLDRPMRRAADGGWSAVSWDEALDDIATRLRAVVDEHGPEAVAIYLGNPTAFNATAGVAAGLFLRLLGSDRLFSAGTQDCANKFAVGELLWGSAQLHLIPDVDHTDHLLVLGSNPRISKGSFLSVPDPIGRFGAVEARGGTVRFVDPRRIEPKVGEVVQIRPDTDVYLLAAMLHEIDRTTGFDPDGAARVADPDALRTFLADYAPERVAPVVGIGADRIATLAHEFASAPSAAVHVSTGVNMGRQGALAYWLATMLSLLTGNLDRRGGNVPATRGTAANPSERGTDAASFLDSPWGTYRPVSSMHPGALLADMIRADADVVAGATPIRALVVLAGNPVLSIGGGDQLAAALSDLDLLVSIDLYRNATGELADYVLPAADWFEREDLNVFVQGTQTEPYVQWTGPLVEPAAERRTERVIFTDLTERLGLPVFFPHDADLLGMVHDGALGAHGLSVEAVRQEPGGTVLLAPTEPGGFLDRATPHGTIDGAPEMLAIARERAAALFDELLAEPPDQLKLITRRTSHTLNSAMQNVRRLKDTGAADNPLYVGPDDAGRLGLHDGDRVRIANRFGEIEAAVRINDTLRAGVVAMTHGFGNAGVTGMAVAAAFPGVNVNALAPHGPGTIDPVSGMSQLTGIPVEVVRV